jgi:hypothetical protein
MLECGAKKILDMGCGDDSPEKGMEAGLHEWLDQALRFWKFLLKKKFLTSPQSKYPLLGVQAVSVQVLSNKKSAAKPTTETSLLYLSATQEAIDPWRTGLAMPSRSSLRTIPRLCLISLTRVHS